MGSEAGDFAIAAEGLSKRYRLGGTAGYKALRDVLTGAAKAPARAARAVVRGRRPTDGRQEAETIWALDDVSFKVDTGEVVGIIGRNGAGKTTLLRILSRITHPTRGSAKIRGRVGSLLEVGTGFHPELTGSENIQLNAAILGMRRYEIRERFNDIVDFAETERFLDTPVKHYSSGMYVRLAFSVAAHLEPDILLVDEVLAVGDHAFQEKCVGKMGEVAGAGRTVMVVSHNLTMITNLCSRVILLDSGRVVMDDETGAVVKEYIASGHHSNAVVSWEGLDTAPGTDLVRLQSVRILGEDGNPAAEHERDRDVTVEITYRTLRDGAKCFTTIFLKDELGSYVLNSSNRPSATLDPDPWYNKPRPTGVYRARCVIPGGLLNIGLYTISAVVGTDVDKTHVYERDVLTFRSVDPVGAQQDVLGKWIGSIRPRLAWTTDPVGGREMASGKVVPR